MNEQNKNTNTNQNSISVTPNKKPFGHKPGAGSANRAHTPQGNSSHTKRTGIRRMGHRAKSSRPAYSDSKSRAIVPPVGDNIRIIPLGGVEQVGQNMTAIEIGNDIIVIDAGFQFKEESTPGIDYILPNTKYLEERKDKIRAMFVTHGHLDHIGAIPYIIEKIGSPKIYTRQFGAIMIAKRQDEFPHVKKPEIITLDGDETIVVSDTIKVETFPISHAIPDSMGLIIHTPLGKIAFIEDVRVDNFDGVPTPEEEKQYARFKGEEFLLLTMDSTSVEKPGWSLSEQIVVQNIEKIMKDVSGRLLFVLFHFK